MTSGVVDGDHLEVSSAIIFSVHPGQGEEMGELPEKEDTGQGDGIKGKNVTSSGGSPSLREGGEVRRMFNTCI